MRAVWMVYRCAVLGVVVAMACRGGALFAQGGIKPVPFPDVDVEGFQFPERSDVINQWLLDLAGGGEEAAAATKNIHLHAWGIWTGLTQATDQVHNDQKLLVFETWLTPGDIQSGARVGADSMRNPRPLQRLRQFGGHGNAKADFGPGAAALPAVSTVVGFVKYDPTAASHIVQNDLFSADVLTTLLDAGEDEIPTFPMTAIALKPVFQAMPSGQLVDGRYYQLSTWPGPPGTTPPGPPVPFGQDAWHACVWIDVKNQGQGDGSVDTKCAKDGSSRTPQSTYNVSDFINFQASAADAKAYNEQQVQGGSPNPNMRAGDYFALVGMHVTSREITRWTWQTFWWAANPDEPHFPSSKAIAAVRPKQLQGAPRHYAAAVGYSMVVPVQPVTGGENVGNSVYAYNPYLEAPFPPQVLPDSVPGTYEGRVVANTVGIHTNCMSCHGRANYNPNNLSWAPNYTGDRYVDLNDPRFRGTLRVDFLWSIPGNVQSGD